MIELLLAVLVRFLPLTYVYGWSPTRPELADQLLMTLMRLKLNYPLLDLAHRFATSTHTVANITITLSSALHKILHAMHATLPSANKCSHSQPASFAGFRNCRIILDGTEMPMEVPHLLKDQAYTYSSYKSSHTTKILVGVAPNGAIVYVSPAYPGNTSDKAICVDTGIMTKLSPGDLVLADKGNI